MKLPVIFERYRNEIDAELRSALANYKLPLYDMMCYHLGWIDGNGHPLQTSAGKALRPTLCLLASETINGDFRKALPAAAAIELIHNFSLIHDDIQDDDEERRHRPTVWSIWGKPQAINAGTAMRVTASLTLLRLQRHSIPLQKQLDAHRLLDERCLTMIEGQYLDLSYEGHFDIGVDDYLDMVDRKTAALIACSLELGALLGTDDVSIINGLGKFGRDLGLGFQIRDDIIGIWGDEQKTGKPSAGDIKRRKKSFPVVYALGHANGEAKAGLIDIYNRPDIDTHGLNAVLEILDEVQARTSSQGMAEGYRDKALAQLDKISLSPWARSNLEEMAHFLVEREF